METLIIIIFVLVVVYIVYDQAVNTRFKYKDD